MATKKTKRRQHTDEHKYTAAQRVISGGESIGKVLADLDLADNVLRSWIRKVKTGELVAPAATTKPPTPGSLAPPRPPSASHLLPTTAELDTLRAELAAARAEIKRLRRVIDTLLGD